MKLAKSFGVVYALFATFSANAQSGGLDNGVALGTPVDDLALLGLAVAALAAGVAVIRRKK